MADGFLLIWLWEKILGTQKVVLTIGQRRLLSSAFRKEGRREKVILIDHIGHMVATESEMELHIFAKKIGLKRAWFQNSGRFPHYDLTTKRKMNKTLAEGAKQVPTKDLMTEAWWAKEKKENE